MPATFSLPQEKLYICPGESRPISRAVHLSRLAAFFPACRDCPFRSDTGNLPRQTVERLQSTERRVERDSLFTTEGVRGVYLNELNRRKAEQIAAAFAGLLWDEAPLMGRVEPGRTGPRRPGPAVVVGHDDRPSSPDIATGVVAALRRMGCQVIDIGLTTKPCFWFAADHLQVAAGILVTGSGRDPSWTGLDFVGRGALPLSLELPADQTATDNASDLGRVEARTRSRLDRPTRHAGSYRTFQALVPYQAGLLKHFHALRSLTICVATSVPLVRRILARLFESLPCRLLIVDVPCRARNTNDPRDADVQRLGTAAHNAGADLGVLIDDDGQRCAVCDEGGTLVSPAQVTSLLAAEVLREHPGAPVVSEPDAPEWGGCLGATVQPIPARAASLAAMSSALREHAAVFGGGRSGRYWFREAFPTSDGILTLARILSALSHSDAALSDVVARYAAASASAEQS